MTYVFTELLVQSVTSPTTRLFVRNLGSNPIAEVLLIFFRELSSPMNGVNVLTLRTRV